MAHRRKHSLAKLPRRRIWTSLSSEGQRFHGEGAGAQKTDANDCLNEPDLFHIHISDLDAGQERFKTHRYDGHGISMLLKGTS